MATPTCQKCGHHTFELKENVPRDSRFKLLFVQCSSCGTVVGVMDYYNIGTKLIELEDKVDRIMRRLNA